MDIPERLRYARQRTGLSGAQVKHRTCIGESSLSEFENGKREPSLSQLQKLATAYRRSVSFFLTEGPVPEETVLWREGPAEGTAEVEARFLRLCEQYHNLEIWTDDVIPVCLPPAKEKSAGYSYRDAEALAKQVRDQLELGDRPGLCLLPFLEEVCGVKVFHLEFEPSGTAASAKSETFGAAVLLNARNVRWRRNFDLAHELFHLLTWERFRTSVEGHGPSSCADELEEKFATCFARNLLMPSDAVRTAINAKIKDGRLAFEDVFDVARQFAVSVESLLWHMLFLHLLSGDADETRKLIGRAHELAPLLAERKNTELPLWPERYRALAIKALRHGHISIGRFAEYLDIGRHEAMKYVEQEVTDDEEVPLAPA